jgi:RHS repeat-associated protein
MNALGEETVFTYNSDGTMADVTDARNNTTAYQYLDSHKNLTKVIDADSNESTLVYDDNGNVTSMTDANSHVTTMTYDGKNRILTVTDPLSRVTTFDYDGNGNLLSVVDALGRTTTFTYSKANQLVLVENELGHLIQISYDANGNLRFLRYQKTDGTLIRRYEWTYDDSNNRESMLDVDPSRAVKWEYGFDWLDRLVTVKRAEAADVGSLTATTLQREYVFDESDNRTFFDDHVNGVTYHYKYKSIDDNGTTRYSDQLDEILIYPTAAGHRTVGDFVSFESLEHDADGNLTKRTIAATGEEIEMSWSDFDRLKRVESDQNGRMQDARYDVDGLRERKLDRQGNSSEEYGVGISTSASTPGSKLSGAPTISYIQGSGGIIGAEIDGDFVFHLGDALSTVRDVVDDTGAVIKSFEFDEYGNLLSATGTGDTSPKTWIGGLSVNDDRADSGMFNMGHRNYAAGVLGRFISRDPIGHAGNLNLYAYPTNPVRFTDPSGLQPLPQHFGLPSDVMDRARAESQNCSLPGPATSGQSWPDVFKQLGQYLIGSEMQSEFGPNSQAVFDLKQAPGVREARRLFYVKNRGKSPEAREAWTDGGSRFDAARFIEATENNNATRHYIGSFDIDVYPENCGKDIRFVIQDTKTPKSLFYRIPFPEVTTGYPLGTQTQTYTWTEPYKSEIQQQVNMHE